MNPKETYTGIQSLRLVAAMFVVAHHAVAMVGQRLPQPDLGPSWQAGQAGVDLFFVISGFVMAVSSRKLVDRAGAGHIFLTRRLIRIVPMYWIATTLKIVLVLATPAAVLTTSLGWRTVAASYLFLPTFDAGSNLVYPVLKVGWTLNYEMLFYVLFALALFARKPALKVTALMFVICTLINLASAPDFPLGYRYFNPILLEFIFGMLAAEVVQRTVAVNRWIAGVAVAIAFGVILVSGDLPRWWRWVYWGVPSLVIVLVVALTEPLLRRSVPKVFASFGDASYSLYLFHTFVVPAVGVALLRVHQTSPVLAVVACLILSPLLAMVIYRSLELPLTSLLKRIVAGRSPAAARDSKVRDA